MISEILTAETLQFFYDVWFSNPYKNELIFESMFHHIETSHLNSKGNELTCFYMMGTLNMKSFQFSRPENSRTLVVF